MEIRLVAVLGKDMRFLVAVSLRIGWMCCLPRFHVAQASS